MKLASCGVKTSGRLTGRSVTKVDVDPRGWRCVLGAPLVEGLQPHRDEGPRALAGSRPTRGAVNARADPASVAYGGRGHRVVKCPVPTKRNDSFCVRMVDEI